MDMNVQLKLTRAVTVENQFSLWDSVPEHCAEAAVTLFLADALELYKKIRRRAERPSMFSGARAKTRKTLEKLVASSKKIMQEKLSGGACFTLRVAAFTILLRFLPANPSDDAVALEWAQSRGLRGNVRESNWLLSDLMFALDTLAVHWESFGESVWSQTPLEALDSLQLQERPDSFQGYLRFLWQQCAKFVLMRSPEQVKTYMDADTFTLPYDSPDGSGHQIALHTDAVSAMCELWRWMQYEAGFPMSRSRLASWQHDPVADEAAFVALFEFEKRQLEVDKFRENLRTRFASRHLVPGDSATYASLSGKDPEPDAVMEKKSCTNLPGYLQKIASAWSFEQMLMLPHIKDELFRAMADSGCRSKVGCDFSTRFYSPAGPPHAEETPRLQIPVIKRYMHAYTIVYKGEGVTPPIPFASAFAAWARLVRDTRLKPYGVNFRRVCEAF